MRQWRLVAADGLERATETIEASAANVPHSLGDTEAEREQFDATTTAIARVMNLASESELWAQGRIELWSPDNELVHVMEAKTGTADFDV